MADMEQTEQELREEIVSLREQLAAAVNDATALRHQLAAVQEHAAVVSAHEQDLVRDGENLSDALAECVHLLDTCTPGRFRDRELGDLLRGYSMLAGAEARDRVKARLKELPTLGTPSSVFAEPTSTCCEPPPSLAINTHLGCSFPAGHGGDHLWKPRDAKQNAITGQVPR
jgi:hypothetical protein